MTWAILGLNAPAGAWCSLTDDKGFQVVPLVRSQCTCRCVVLPDRRKLREECDEFRSQCTYRCVVLPDMAHRGNRVHLHRVSMHLQVRGAP